LTPRPALSRAGWGHLAMLTFSALVGGSFVLGAMAAPLVDPAALNALRFLLAAAVIGAAALATTGLPRSAARAPWRYGVLGGLFAIYFVLMFEGLKTAPPVSAAAVFTLTPLMAAGFGWLILRQRLTRRMAGALLIGAAGALWVIFRGDPAALLALDFGPGERIYLIGCVAHAAYTPMVRRLNRGEPAVVFTFGTLLAGCAIMAVWGWRGIRATDWAALPAIFWVALAYLAIFASAASFVLLQAATLRLPSAKVMAYTYLVPGWVILWQMAFGQPHPPALVLGGVALTLIALAQLLKDEAKPAA
jgi:drug/metabolite transporter (DMT)-like permease